MEIKPRKPHLGNGSDYEPALAASYLALMRTDARQYRHDARALFDALRGMS